MTKINDHTLLVAYALLVLSIPVFTGCNQATVQPVAALPANAGLSSSDVETVPVEYETHSVVVEVPASVEGFEMAMLTSRLEAYVGRVLVDIGDEVEQDQVLAELEAPEMTAEEERLSKVVLKTEADRDARKAELIQAQSLVYEQQAMLKYRESELKRMQGLVQSGALNREKLDEAQYAVEAVKAAMQRAEADISAAKQQIAAAEADIQVANAELRKALALATYLQIRAPFAGLITARSVDLGELVRPATDGGSMLFEIQQVHKLRVVFHLPMEDAAELDGEDEVTLHGIYSAPNQEFKSKVTRFANAFNRESRAMRAEIDLDNPLDEQKGSRKLKPGDYGKVTITTVVHENIATVPAGVVASDDEGDFVMAVDSRNICRRRPVIVAVQTAEKAGITKPDGGRFDAELVIAKDISSFKDGQKLE